MGRYVDDREIVHLADPMQEPEAIPEGEGLHRPVFGEGVDILNDDAAEGANAVGNEIREGVLVNAGSGYVVLLFADDRHIEHLDAWRASYEFDEGQGAVESGVDAENDGLHLLRDSRFKVPYR